MKLLHIIAAISAKFSDTNSSACLCKQVKNRKEEFLLLNISVNRDQCLSTFKYIFCSNVFLHFHRKSRVTGGG